MSTFISIPGVKEYYDSLMEDTRKHKELQATPEYFEMTREE
jgi:hypothetical protein